MFTVQKIDLPRYWYAYTGNVEERIGSVDDSWDEEHNFLSQLQAECAASNWLYIQAVEHRNRLENTNRALSTRALRVRALWDRKVRDSLKRFDKNLQDARHRVYNLEPVKVRLLPYDIPVEGTRLAVGTEVYEIDSYAMTIRSSKVVSERIAYYTHKPEGTPAYYTLENGRGVRSDLKSGFSNVEHYTDRGAAVQRIRELWTQRIQELEDQLKSLE